nr:MAG TPA: hypothetical protein [Caudoviricetes sp.]
MALQKIDNLYGNADVIAVEWFQRKGTISDAGIRKVVAVCTEKWSEI